MCLKGNAKLYEMQNTWNEEEKAWIQNTLLQEHNANQM